MTFGEKKGVTREKAEDIGSKLGNLTAEKKKNETKRQQKKGKPGTELNHVGKKEFREYEKKKGP